MQTKLNKFTQKTRKNIRSKLKKHSSTHSSLISLHRFYCNATGFLHVLPNYYIIGGQKCGTGSLYTYLLQHPNVQPAISKEPSYFDRYYDRGLNWYKICFPFGFHKTYYKKIKKQKFVTGEASVRYLDHPFTPKRLKKITPNAKFIILLRNPIDRAYSHYTMINNRGGGNSPFGDKLSFEEAIEKEEERIEGQLEKMLTDPNYYSDIYFRHSYLQRGIYVDKLERWFSVFPKEHFLIIQSEEFFKNTAETYKQVLEFLDLSDFKLPEYKQIGKARYKQPKMNQNTRNELVEYFKPYNKRLYELLGRKFDWDE